MFFWENSNFLDLFADIIANISGSILILNSFQRSLGGALLGIPSLENIQNRMNDAGY